MVPRSTHKKIVKSEPITKTEFDRICSNLLNKGDFKQLYEVFIGQYRNSFVNETKNWKMDPIGAKIHMQELWCECLIKYFTEFGKKFKDPIFIKIAQGIERIKNLEGVEEYMPKKVNASIPPVVPGIISQCEKAYRKLQEIKQSFEPKEDTALRMK
jgi:hypothetical protein